jgi:hypothetical protein
MDFDERSFDPECETGRDCTLYRVVVPEQNIVVRVNGLDPDSPEDDYLRAVRPYGLLRMAWAIWREVPDMSPKKALSLALRIRCEGQMEVLVTTPFLAEHVQGRLLARHHLVARLECEG